MTKESVGQTQFLLFNKTMKIKIKSFQIELLRLFSIHHWDCIFKLDSFVFTIQVQNFVEIHWLGEIVYLQLYIVYHPSRVQILEDPKKLAFVSFFLAIKVMYKPFVNLSLNQIKRSKARAFFHLWIADQIKNAKTKFGFSTTATRLSMVDWPIADKHQ